MVSPAALPNPAPVPPPPEPQAIRACLTPDVAAEFDREWEIVLERAKQAKDLAPVHDLLHKWRHFAYSELKEPGTYFRLLPPLRTRWRPARPRPAASRLRTSRR
jgi:hypothetical protein